MPLLSIEKAIFLKKNKQINTIYCVIYDEKGRMLTISGMEKWYC